jgi:flagellar protein FlaG
MEIPSYNLSNIQSYGSQSGIKFASTNSEAAIATEKSYATSGQTDRTEKSDRAEQEKKVEKSTDSVEAAVKLAKQREKINEEQRQEMMDRMEEFVSSINKNLSFRVDKESGRDVVTIYEASTGDVIRQIPEEEMLEVLRRLARDREHHSGLVMTQV